MSDLAGIKERYLRDDVPVRLGNLAANLARLGSLLNNPTNREAADRLLTESKFFIEWTASETDVEVAGQLVELQVQLARWQIRLPGILDDPEQQSETAQHARRWSDRILQVSGLTQVA